MAVAGLPSSVVKARVTGWAPLLTTAPIELPGGPGQEPWRPQNDDDAPPGPHTLRYGVEHSRKAGAKARARARHERNLAVEAESGQRIEGAVGANVGF